MNLNLNLNLSLSLSLSLTKHATSEPFDLYFLFSILFIFQTSFTQPFSVHTYSHPSSISVPFVSNFFFFGVVVVHRFSEFPLHTSILFFLFPLAYLISVLFPFLTLASIIFLYLQQQERLKFQAYNFLFFILLFYFFYKTFQI